MAYREIMDALARSAPSAWPFPQAWFQPTDSLGPGGDLAGLIGSTRIQEEELGLKPLRPRRAVFTTWPASRLAVFRCRPEMVQDSRIDDPDLLRGVIFHDSFANALMPFLSEHFSRLVYVHETFGFDPSLIEAEKPAVVIQEATERFLMLDPAPLRKMDP